MPMPILKSLEGEEVHFESIDYKTKQTIRKGSPVEFNGVLDLHKGVYDRIRNSIRECLQDLNCQLLLMRQRVPDLGTSSTLVVAIVGAFTEMLKLPLGEYDIAHLAYEIERKDLKMAGGKQDQYAATFGGVNYMEFFDEDKVIVNPLRVKQQYLFELENNLLLYYTATSRESAKIITQQSQNVVDKKSASIEAMHQLKQQSQRMKEALLKGQAA